MYLYQTEVKFGLKSSCWIHAILSYFLPRDTAMLARSWES